MVRWAIATSSITDLRIAEGVTLTGQMVIQWAEKAINLEMNKIMKTSGVDYVIAIDTDSLYINFGEVVEKLNPKDPVSSLIRYQRNTSNLF